MISPTRPLIAVTLLLAFAISCIPQPYVSYDTKQNIRLSEIQETKTTLADFSNTCTPSTSQCQYTVYKLPYVPTTDYASTIELSVTIDDIDSNSLKNRGYFAVIVNASNEERNIYSYVQNYTTSNSGLALHEPFTVKKKRTPSRLLAQQKSLTPEKQYDSYCDEDKSKSRCIQNKRTFFFGHGTQDPNDPPAKPVTTTLRKKITFTVDGKPLYFAFWVEDGKEFEDFFKTNLEENLKELYEILYKMNGNKHMWGDHDFKEYLVGDSVIHIALGNIGKQKNKNGITAAFVDSRTTYYNIRAASNYQREDITAPTIYVNINPYFKDRGLLIFYSTLAHEFQHVFINYQKTILNSHSPQATVHHVDTWIHETLAVAAQYYTEYKILEQLTKAGAQHHAIKEAYFTNGPTYSAKDYPEYIYKEWYHSAQTILRTTSLTTNKNFTPDSYKLAYLFVSYLVQNYGSEVMRNALTNSHRNSYALVTAVQNTLNYSKLPAALQPKTMEDILVQFFTAIFTSNIEYKLNNTSHNYKFLTYAPNYNTEKFGCKTTKNVCTKNSFDQRKQINVIAAPQLFISSANLAPEHNISSNNVIFDAKANNIQNPNYTLISGKYAVGYLGGRFGNNTQQGVFKTNKEGVPYFTITLNKGSAVNLVVIEYL